MSCPSAGKASGKPSSQPSPRGRGGRRPRRTRRRRIRHHSPCKKTAQTPRGAWNICQARGACPPLVKARYCWALVPAQRPADPLLWRPWQRRRRGSSKSVPSCAQLCACRQRTGRKTALGTANTPRWRPPFGTGRTPPTVMYAWPLMERMGLHFCWRLALQQVRPLRCTAAAGSETRSKRRVLANAGPPRGQPRSLPRTRGTALNGLMDQPCRAAERRNPSRGDDRK
mmetsp:Transcript_111082/g.313358  ORF Transcript_111082/g.313358 Transcript_111082/m.313358 type:complete len:227 (+) Transcript_111082:696-1376(+)